MVTKLDLLLVGDSCVGKTSMLEMVRTGVFCKETNSSVGLNNISIKKTIDDESYLFWITDTPGQNPFRTITRNSLKKAHGVLLVFDLSDLESFNNVNKWLEMIKAEAFDPVIFLVGNKSDLTGEMRRVTSEKIENFIVRNDNIRYYETSAKEKVIIDEVFEAIYQAIVDKYKAGKIKVDKSLTEKDDNNKDKGSGCC